MFVAALSGYDQCLVEDKTAVSLRALLCRECKPFTHVLPEPNARSFAPVRIDHELDMVQELVHHPLLE